MNRGKGAKCEWQRVAFPLRFLRPLGGREGVRAREYSEETGSQTVGRARRRWLGASNDATEWFQFRRNPSCAVPSVGAGVNHRGNKGIGEAPPPTGEK